jgi:organic hydroperoxide reductase OsmC/OhrA
MSHVHEYRSELRWRGSTADGYDDYERGHVLRLPPAGGEWKLSSDPAFRGDGERPNPEQLLLGAASSCQLLSFLALAARSRIDVVAYEDAATAEMPEDVTPMRITRIVLRPQVVVAAGSEVDRVHRLLGRAHETCYVANTLNAEMEIAATVTTAAQ